MTNPNLRRLITVFRTDREDRAAEIDVTHIPFETIRAIVVPGANDPLLYDCYKLDAGQLSMFQRYVHTDLEKAGFDYYLEAEADLGSG